MLTIKAIIPGDTEGRFSTWHVGEPLPLNDDFIYDSVAMIQVDGDELDAVAHLGVQVPTGLRVVSWFGDQAKFIVAALRNRYIRA